MNFFGIGLPEMILILVVALLVFGPKKLPEIGKSLGKALRSFQDASRDFQDEFKRQAAAIEGESTSTASLPAQASAPEVISAPTSPVVTDVAVAADVLEPVSAVVAEPDPSSESRSSHPSESVESAA